MSDKKNCPMCGGEMPEKRIYTMGEVRSMCKDLDRMEIGKAGQILDELKAAQHEGRIVEA